MKRHGTTQYGTARLGTAPHGHAFHGNAAQHNPYNAARTDLPDSARHATAPRRDVYNRVVARRRPHSTEHSLNNVHRTRSAGVPTDPVGRVGGANSPCRTPAFRRLRLGRRKDTRAGMRWVPTTHRLEARLNLAFICFVHLFPSLGPALESARRGGQKTYRHVYTRIPEMTTAISTKRRIGVPTVLMEQFPMPHTRGSSHGASRVIRLLGDETLAALEYARPPARTHARTHAQPTELPSNIASNTSSNIRSWTIELSLCSFHRFGGRYSYEQWRRLEQASGKAHLDETF